ncbi:BspA family leucine-rich repeat surface protein [Campylobacter sp. US12a]|uniref:BspA family leucine-rich repeat surface protein n=1 Tax=Campylobacter sp. US12a TaxID=2498116 RepID=UPI001FBBC6CB|nr:BspA family leucine-rich repeat surface protein [Campylobacter sp. US12a]
MKKYLANTKEELKTLVKGEAIHLGDIDTSKITDMSYLFFYSQRTDFSGIEKWDVSNVENMSFMFVGCPIDNSNMPSKEF